MISPEEMKKIRGVYQNHCMDVHMAVVLLQFVIPQIMLCRIRSLC